MHTIQLGPRQWLILDDLVRPRYLVSEGPMVRRDTGETHDAWRIDWWAVDRKGRHTVAVVGGLLAAEAWCRYELEQQERARSEVSRSVDITRQATP